MAFSVEYIYTILNRYSGPLNKITMDTQRYQKAASKAATKVRKLSDRLKSAGDRMTDIRSAIGGAAITASIFKFTKSASTMEDAMADVSRVTGLTGPGLKAMQIDLQKLGRFTGRSALGLAAIAYEGGKLSIANENLDEFVFMVLKTAAAFDMTEQEAGRSIGSIRAKLGMSVSSVNELMQRVNYLSDTTSATGASMIEIIERTSGSMKMLNVPNEVLAGWAAFANQIEVTPQLAASGINMMMSHMMMMPGMLDKMLEDPKNSVIKFLQRFEKMPEAQRGTKILKEFGKEAGRFVMKAVSNMKLLDDAMEKSKATEALGSMDREFANILARSSTAASRIRETFFDISRAIGVVFLGMFNKYSDRLASMAEKMLSFVKAHPVLIKTIGILALLLAGLTAIVVLIGMIALAISGILPLLSGALALFSAMSLPVLAVVAAVTALSSAVYQLVSNWNALTAPGFFKDLAGWASELLELDKIGQPMPGNRPLAGVRDIGASIANEKAQTRAAINNRMEAGGEIRVSAAPGSQVDSASINLNQGYNLAVAH